MASIWLSSNVEMRSGTYIPNKFPFHPLFISDTPSCRSYPSCSGAVAPGLAADLHFQQNAIAFIGPACAFALEPVARLAAYWNTPIITGMGDQPPSEGELSVTSGILSRHLKKANGTSVRS
ncbi:hypothetical protein FOCC_FOCC008937 [Frankliniella occidentalis]|nr:hypothetical protein FOCC_FOCC008937 [Frankliniella occidentalis]